MGLGLSQAVFSMDADAEDILTMCYSRTSQYWSHARATHFCVWQRIPTAWWDRRGRQLDDGYVQVILNQAKLYIRPLQKDTSVEHMKPYSIPDVRNVGLYGCLVRMLCGIGSGEPNIYKNKKH